MIARRVCVVFFLFFTLTAFSFPSVYSPSVSAQSVDLIINGDFSSPSQWYVESNSVWNSNGYFLPVYVNLPMGIFQEQLFQSDHIYRISFDLVIDSGEFFFYVGAQPSSFYTSSGHFSEDLQCTNCDGMLHLYTQNDFVGHFDNVSAFEVLPVTETPTPSSGGSFFSQPVLSTPSVSLPSSLGSPGATASDVVQGTTYFTSSYILYAAVAIVAALAFWAARRMVRMGL